MKLRLPKHPPWYHNLMAHKDVLESLVTLVKAITNLLSTMEQRTGSRPQEVRGRIRLGKREIELFLRISAPNQSLDDLSKPLAADLLPSDEPSGPAKELFINGSRVPKRPNTSSSAPQKGPEHKEEFDLNDFFKMVQSALDAKVYEVSKLLTDLAVHLGDLYDACLTQRVTEHLVIDFKHREARGNGKKIPLTPIEFALLVYLASPPNTVRSKDEIAIAVWPDEYPADGTIQGAISSLRGKLEAASLGEMIVTHRGFGYKLCTKQDGTSEQR